MLNNTCPSYRCRIQYLENLIRWNLPASRWHIDFLRYSNSIKRTTAYIRARVRTRNNRPVSKKARQQKRSRKVWPEQPPCGCYVKLLTSQQPASGPFDYQSERIMSYMESLEPAGITWVLFTLNVEQKNYQFKFGAKNDRITREKLLVSILLVPGI